MFYKFVNIAIINLTQWISILFTIMMISIVSSNIVIDNNLLHKDKPIIYIA